MLRDEFPEEKTAVVYWLHLKEHTDVYTQGYVGVTTRLIEVRFKEHCTKFNSSYNSYSPLHLAFAQYGLDNIVRTRLCVCSESQAYYIEKLFRPFEYMGWNTTEGGKLPKSIRNKINRK